MSSLELFILAIGLSMDAFAVAVCKGLSMKQFSLKKAGIVGLYFGFFQAAMPLIGFLLGVSFSAKIESVDHWIAFILLLIIGGNMIKESFHKDSESSNDSVSFSNMIVLAIATSIDALAVGITFACLTVNIPIAIGFIGVITFSLSMLGVKIGNVFGAAHKSKAEFAGGFILILLGSKILFEHLGIF